ncbi:MAG: lysophospholipid acyltransferase family protein [Syntrophobacteraceae bacterium]
MRVIRSLFFYITLAFSTILLGLSAVIGSFVHKSWPHWMASAWGNVNIWAAGVKVTMAGLENVDPRKPYILASNHQGWFDIFAALGKLPIRFSWLAKEELFKIPILGHAMHTAGYIPIDRTDHRKAINSMNKAAEIIRQGTSVFIFPEGTRSPDGVMMEFKKGGFVLAAKSNQPIVPISISGSYRILRKGSWLIHPGEIRFSLGSPVYPEGADAKSRDILKAKIAEAIRSNLTDEEAGRVAGDQS